MIDKYHTEPIDGLEYTRTIDGRTRYGIQKKGTDGIVRGCEAWNKIDLPK